MRKGTWVPRKGALKNSKAKQDDNTPLVITPGTFDTNPSAGCVKRGVDLLKCYQGPYNKNDLRHGRGVYKYANGYATYEGEYVNGVKHGYGTLTFKDGSFYEGDFVNGEIEGQGTRRFNNGNRYVGDFHMGEMHGKGTLWFKSRDLYEGEMMHNKMHGNGILYFQNGDMYRGEFVEHRRTGQGTMEYENGDRYRGSWKDGKRCGRGSCKFSDGNRYSGNWDNDTLNGKGILNVPKLGIWYDGLFVDGKPVQVPTKMNIFWFEDPTAAPPKGKKAGSKTTPDDALPLLVNTPGTPLSVPLHVAAQMLAPIPPPKPQDQAPPPPAPPTPSTPGKTTIQSRKSKDLAAAEARPPEPPKPMITEAAPEGMQWQTAEMEFGRVVTLSLHASPPQPTPPEQPLGVTLVTSVVPEGDEQGQAGQTVVRLLLLPSVKLDTPLPLRRSPTQPQERVSALEMTLHQGHKLFESLLVGEAADLDRLYVPNGVGHLVISAHGLQPGYCRVQLPDLKTFKPPKVR